MNKVDEDVLPCRDKLAFVTRQQAEAAAAVAAYRHGSKLQVYKCRYCQAWHLTSRESEE